ncbi:MAG: iron-containing alcohol dehydrogenase [Negativicutes bacterium]|nr:iron-containing alcohol dehydrogenase [Negativicutes bacterium]
MENFKLATELMILDGAEEFVSTLLPSEKDLIITNAVIYDTHLASFGLKSRVVYQENYGAGEPSDKMINTILKDVHDQEFQRIFAIGGGTVIDVGKALSVAGVTDILDVLYGRLALKKGHELIAVPTTCGTGSEVTNIAILEDTTAHVKKGIVGPEIFPDKAVLVPAFLKGIPYKFFAFSSIDALIHAVESFVAPRSNQMTELHAIKAMQQIIGAYQEIVAAKGAIADELYRRVLLASTFAGIAFGNTGVGAVHAMSYPLGGKYHVAHGESNYAFLGVVLSKYEELNPTGRFVELRGLLADILGVKAQDAVTALADLLNNIIPLKRLREYGVQEAELGEFAQAAMAQERLMKNNYVPLSAEVVYDMFKSRF